MKPRSALSRRELLQALAAALASRPAAATASHAVTSNPVFVDVAASSGITFQHDPAASPEKYLIETMGSGCGWIDYDQDGLMDLYLVNGAATRIYQPRRPLRSALYRNNGDGTFTDVSQSSGVGLKSGNGLGVVTFDYDNDGWQDIFIANDSMANFLFHNNRDGTFREVGYLAGVAVSADGRTEAGMGTDAADTTGSGWLDLVVTHLDFEHARLYRNLRDGSFEDATFEAKLGYATFHLSGFGACFMDYDNDGARDVFMANGHILDNIQLYHADTQYAEPKLMFRNTGRGTFEDVSSKLGPDFQLRRVSRGAAVGDFDNDGDLDILVSINSQVPQLLRYDGGTRHHSTHDLL